MLSPLSNETATNLKTFLRGVWNMFSATPPCPGLLVLVLCVTNALTRWNVHAARSQRNSEPPRRMQCSGIIQASHACDPGSTPGMRIFSVCLLLPRCQIGLSPAHHNCSRPGVAASRGFQSTASGHRHRESHYSARPSSVTTWNTKHPWSSGYGVSLTR